MMRLLARILLLSIVADVVAAEDAEAPPQAAQAPTRVLAMMRPLADKKWQVVVSIPEELRFLFLRNSPCPDIVIGEAHLKLNNPLVDTNAAVVYGVLDRLPKAEDRVRPIEPMETKTHLLSPGISDREIRDSLRGANEVVAVARVKGRSKTVEGETLQLVALRYSHFPIETNSTARICLLDGKQIHKVAASVTKEEFAPEKLPRLVTQLIWVRLPAEGNFTVLCGTLSLERALDDLEYERRLKALGYLPFVLDVKDIPTIEANDTDDVVVALDQLTAGGSKSQER